MWGNDSDASGNNRFKVNSTSVRDVVAKILNRCTFITKSVTFDIAYGALSTPTKAGYACNGRYKIDGIQVVSSTIFGSTSDVVLYEHWTKN